MYLDKVYDDKSAGPDYQLPSFLLYTLLPVQSECNISTFLIKYHVRAILY